MTDVAFLPEYYTRLAPFCRVFLSGKPFLTYHHVGPRPRGARLKGLYVSPRLFSRQMAELAEAGFCAPELSRSELNSTQKSVFLTFDDGFQDIFQHALPALNRHRFRGMVFLVSDLIGKTNVWQQQAGDVCESLMGDAAVREWLAAGHRIGSHTRTHPRLTELSTGSAREEIRASKRILEDRFGVPIEHFCYPYGDCNQAISGLVAEAGYHTACTTESGVNVAGQSPFMLKRFTARYRSRSLKSLWAWLKPSTSSRTDLPFGNS